MENCIHEFTGTSESDSDTGGAVETPIDVIYDRHFKIGHRDPNVPSWLKRTVTLQKKRFSILKAKVLKKVLRTDKIHSAAFGGNPVSKIVFGDAFMSHHVDIYPSSEWKSPTTQVKH